MRSPASWGACFLFVCLGLLALSMRATSDGARRDILATVWNLRAASSNVRLASAPLADPKTGTVELMAALTGKHGVRQVLYNVDALTAQAARTSTTALVASRDEQQRLAAISDAALAFLRRTDEAVNEGTLPALTATLRSSKAAIDGLATDGRAMLQASTKSVTAVGDLFASKDVTEAFRHVNLISGHLEDLALHADGAVKHLETTTGYVEGFAYDWTHPAKVGFWKQLAITAATHAAGPVGGAIVSHAIPTRISGEVKVKQ